MSGRCAAVSEKCGHCRIGDQYVCVDGPVFLYTEAKNLMD